jgi:hypothetical protein
MKRDVIGIEVNGREIMTETTVSFSRETRDTKPWIFQALDATENAHATIAAHVMTECITRSKRVSEALIEACGSDDIPLEIDPEHIFPPMIEAILWRPGPVDGEVELCTVSGAPQVQEGVISEEDGHGFLHISHPDAGTIGQLTKITLEDMGGDEWRLLSFMSAGSDKMERALPSGETVSIDAIVNEVACPIDPHEDHRLGSSAFYMATYCMEIAEDDDGMLIVRDYLDEGKGIEDLDSMGLASQGQFLGEHAAMYYPMNLAGYLIDRLQKRPYQSMLDSAGSPIKASPCDKMAGMSFVAGVFHRTAGFGGLISDFVPLMMTASYTEAAGLLMPMLEEVADALDGGDAESVVGITDMLKDACIAFNLFEWSLCALSDSLHRADPLKWNRLKSLMIEIGGTDA